jgi:hypothetical protein
MAAPQSFQGRGLQSSSALDARARKGSGHDGFENPLPFTGEVGTRKALPGEGMTTFVLTHSSARGEEGRSLDTQATPR